MTGPFAGALTAANLVDTLKGAGPFTVFAPSDEAFAKLPAGTVDSLLKDIPKLTAILTYHVVPGAVMASDVMTMDGKSARTVNGAMLAISTRDGVKLNGTTTVVKTDIVCSNGVIHGWSSCTGARSRREARDATRGASSLSVCRSP